MNRLLIVLAAALLCAPACGGREGPERSEGPHHETTETGAAASAGPQADEVRIDPEMLRDLRVTVAAAEQRPGGEGVTALGDLRVNEDAYAEVGVPVPARVLTILAAPGDRVEAGQSLVRLQSQDLGRARAGQLAAKARAELARRALERKRLLASKEVISQRELQEAEAAAASAEADRDAAGSALQSLGVTEEQLAPGDDPSTLVLRSPISGTVIERAVAVGQLADPARPLFRIAGLSRLWLIVHAFERDAVRVRPNGPARVSLPALPGRSFTGKVTLVGRQVDVSSRTIPVRIDLDNKGGLLRPGMSATAWLPLGDEGSSVIAVPATALQRLEDRWCVFLPKDEGAFEVRHVGRGRDLGGEVEILSGLRPGEKVVVEGAFLLKAEAEKSRGEGEHHDH